MKNILKKPLQFVRKNWRIVLVVFVLLIGAGGVWLLQHGERKQVTQKKNEVITYSPDKPDETKPDKNTYQWYGNPEDPKYITLPTIKAEGFLRKVGVDQNKQVATPDNIHMAGWFVETVRPGQKGNSIIDGHVSGWVNNGIFKDLIKMKPGDVYTVEFGSGDKKQFKVKEVKDVPVADAASILFSQDPEITSQLSLITCGGKFNRSTNQYENRVIVISEAI